jgi:nucleoid-associated protein YgaU
MALKKLTIHVECKKPALSFDGGETITALFNPAKLVFNKSVSWKKQEAKDRDVPELQYLNAQPRTLNIDLIFDTYDTPDAEKKDVRKTADGRSGTDELLKLAKFDEDKHRPPVCRLSWGSVRVFFQGVLERLEQQFTMFVENGTPVRATSRCTFKEWRTNYEDLNQQAPQSSDIAKTRIVKRGETLCSIAWEEYRDSGLWRPIADENGIDDPVSLAPGTPLLIPTLTYRKLTGGSWS